MGTRLKWTIVGFVGAVVVITLLVFRAPIVSALFPVSDDWCERLASGEPVRHDPDCQNDPWSGVNYIAAWDRYHGAP